MKWARVLLRALSLLLPAGRRREWRAEWEGELWELERRRRADRSVADPGRFVLGALPHALVEAAAAWTPELLWREVRYAARSLLRARGFTATALLLLVVGVTATTTVYTIANAVLFRPPPGVGDAGSLVQIGRATETHAFDSWSQPLYEAFRARARTVEDIAAYATRELVIGTGSEVHSVRAQVVSANYFDVLRARLTRGTGFAAAAGAPVVVISDALWERRYARAPDVLGRTLGVAGQPFQIAGVAPSGFFGADVGAPAPDLWIPLEQQAVLGGYERASSRQVSWLWLVARTRADVSLSTVRTELGTILDAEQWDVSPEHRSHVALDAGLRIRPEDRVLANRIMLLLMGAVLLVLLIACSNVSALLLARGAARRSELGVRLAIGASRGRIVRQLLLESGLIAVLASVLAYATTHWTARLVARVFPYDVAPSFTPDVRVFGFALLLGGLTTIAFSVMPALHAVRLDVGAVLQPAAARTTARHAWLRSGLVVTQLAFSFALVVGTLLLLRTLHSAVAVSPGYRTSGLVVGSLRFTALDAAAQALVRTQLAAVVDGLTHVPGVRRVGYATAIPGSGELPNRSVWRADSPPTTDLPPIAYHIAVDTGYFGTSGVRLERGRSFDARDTEDAPGVVIVSALLARRLWGRADPIGQRLSFGTIDGERIVEVVGIAADTRNRSLRRAPAAQIYLPYAQARYERPTLLLDVREWSASLERQVLDEIRRVAPDLPTTTFESIDRRLGRSLADVRLIAFMGSAFGVLALILALGGLYGVIAYAATQRRREFAVRLALGAAPLQIVALVLKQGGALVLAGLLAGCLGAALAGRFLQSLLYGVSPLDPLTYAAAAVLLGLAAIGANLVPAVRSARSNPVASLRIE